MTPSADFPRIVTLELTTRCNLACVFCEQRQPGAPDRGDMSWELFTSVIDQVAGTCQRANLWGMGEPFLHADFFRMAGYAAGAGIRRVKVSSNGHLLTPANVERLLESGVTEIRVPLEAASPAAYRAQRRGGRLELVAGGLRRLAERRNALGSPLKIVVCTVYTGQPLADLRAVGRLARDLGADEHEITPNLWRSQLPDLERPQPQARCQKLNHSLSVQANGDVIACCFTCRGEVVFGNAGRTPLAEIWQGAPRQASRQAFLEGKFGYCDGCNYGAGLPFAPGGLLAFEPAAPEGG